MRNLGAAAPGAAAPASEDRGCSRVGLARRLTWLEVGAPQPQPQPQPPPAATHPAASPAGRSSGGAQRTGKGRYGEPSNPSRARLSVPASACASAPDEPPDDEMEGADVGIQAFVVPNGLQGGVDSGSGGQLTTSQAAMQRRAAGGDDSASEGEGDGPGASGSAVGTDRKSVV